MARWCPDGLDGERLVRSAEGALQAEYQGLVLSSVFQPIFDARHLIAMRPGRHGEFFEELLVSCGVAPTRLIVEVTESQFDDRERLQRITRACMVLPKLVDIIHTLGAQVVCEVIETEDQHELALSTSVDFLQGFHYRQPQAELQREQIEVATARA